MHDSTRLAHRSRRQLSPLSCRAVLLLVTISASGCCWLSPHSSTGIRSTAPGLDFQRVSLQRLGCISGDCPVYTVSIDGQGHIHYHGDAGVEVRGDRDAQADPAAMKKLRHLLLSADIVWLQARYTPGHAHCGAWSMDDAAVILEIQAPRLHKHIDHYLGCHSAPRVLERIETAIDRAADAHRWTGAPR